MLPPHIPTTSTELLALIRGHPHTLEYHPRFVHLSILAVFPMISEFLVSLGQPGAAAKQRILLQGKQIPVALLNHCSWSFLFYIPVLTCAPPPEYFLGIWRQLTQIQFQGCLWTQGYFFSLGKLDNGGRVVPPELKTFPVLSGWPEGNEFFLRRVETLLPPSPSKSHCATTSTLVQELSHSCLKITLH